MDNISSFGDVPIIRDVLAHTKEMLSIEHVTVVGNLHWEKMQSLLEALCTQMSLQGQEIQSQTLRLNEQEKRNEAQEKQINDQEKRLSDQEKRLAALQAELDSYKTAMKELQEGRAKEAQEQRDLLNRALKALEDQDARTRKLENQMESLRAGLDANTQALKEIAARLSFVEQDVSVLKPLPERVDALEGNYKKLNAAVANLQQAFRAVDFAKLAKLAMMQPQPPPQPQPLPEQPAPAPEQIIQIIEQPAPEPVIVYQPDLDLANQVDELAKGLDRLNSKVSKQDEHLQTVDVQVEQLRILLDQLTKSYALDLEALRKSLKALRQELDERPIMSFPPAAPTEAPADPSARLEAIMAEMQKRLLRKAEEESVNEVANDLQRLKDTIAEMASTIAILRRRTSSLAIPSLDTLEARMRKAEDDLAGLGTIKADRSALDALELKLSLLGTGGKEVVVDTSGLQGLTDLLSKKADRSELLDLRMLLQALSGRSHNTEIQQLFNAIEELRTALEELKVLARAPAPMMMTDTSDIRADLADHARRLTEHRDLIIELQSLLEKKADLASLQFLKDMMETLRQNKKSRRSIIPPIEPVKEVPDNTSILQQMLAEVTDALNDHERVLRQLTQGVLIMSGHNQGEIITSGVVSAMQPGPILDDDDQLSVVSEAIRPATAISRSNTFYPTTAPTPPPPPPPAPAPAPAPPPPPAPTPAPTPAPQAEIRSPVQTFEAPQPVTTVPVPENATHTPPRVVQAAEAPAPRPVEAQPVVTAQEQRTNVQTDVLQPPELERLRGAERSDPSEVESQSVPAPAVVVRQDTEPTPAVETVTPAAAPVVERNVTPPPAAPEVSHSRKSSPRAPEVSQPRKASPRAVQEEQPPDVNVRAPEAVQYTRPPEVVEVMQYPRPPDTRQRTPDGSGSGRERTPPEVQSPKPDTPPSRPPSRGVPRAPDTGTQALTVIAPAPTIPLSWRRNISPDVPRPLDSTYNALEVALKENKIQPKENVRNKDYDYLRRALEDLQGHVSSIQVVKADKRALDELWQYVRANLSDHAMLSGKPLLGFKCMSCEHSIEKLNPFRSDYLPTNIMPKQWLSMFTAERLYSNQEKRDAPPPQRSPSPPRTGAASPFPKPVTASTPEPGAAPPTRSEQPTTVKPAANVHLGPRVAGITRK